VKRYEIKADAGFARQLMKRVSRYKKKKLGYILYHYFDVGRSYDCLILECENNQRIRVGTYDRKAMVWLAKKTEEIGYENITTDALEVLFNAINNQHAM